MYPILKELAERESIHSLQFDVKCNYEYFTSLSCTTAMYPLQIDPAVAQLIET